MNNCTTIGHWETLVFQATMQALERMDVFFQIYTRNGGRATPFHRDNWREIRNCVRRAQRLWNFFRVKFCLIPQAIQSSIGTMYEYYKYAHSIYSSLLEEEALRQRDNQAEEMKSRIRDYMNDIENFDEPLPINTMFPSPKN
ncbi:hypothetical protein Ciccas_008656 [Cichlidogyrus casuarinus]|uniref:ARID domain-containing protein n=1 Tax=Cichlidogyrus casuarinus TaxID=1844966 RepID=A0ABD2PZ92_9PLAT